MCLKAHAKGQQYLSVYLNLIKGPHDDKLQESGHWPLRGTFIIESLNQKSDTNHYRRILEFNESACQECVIRGKYANVSFGLPHYIPLNEIFI